MAFGAPGLVNTGTQQTIVITCSNPNIVPSGVVTLDGRRESFKSKQTDTIVESEPCDNGGVIDLVRVPGKITGTMEVARQNDAFAAVIALLDSAFYAGLADTPFTITSSEPAVSAPGLPPVSPTAIYQYVNVRFHDYEPGDWARNSKTKCTVSFTCSLKVKLA